MRPQRANAHAGQLLPGLSRAEYERLPGLNWSKLKHMARSPAHYRAALQAEEQDTDALRLGRAIHMAALEPERFHRECVHWSGGVRRGKDWEAFQVAAGVREILKADEWEQCERIRDAVHAHPIARSMLRNGQAECSATWEVDVDGVPVQARGRLDYARGGLLVDLKTTRDASPEAFGRDAFRLMYHAQLAWYADGLQVATGIAPAVKLIAVEKQAPYCVQVYDMQPETFRSGKELYMRLLRTLADCQARNVWPGYSETELPLLLPPWARIEQAQEEGSEEFVDQFNQAAWPE